MSPRTSPPPTGIARVRTFVSVVAASLALASWAWAGGSTVDVPTVAPGFCIQPLATVATRDLAWGPGGAWGNDLYASTSDAIIRIAPDGSMSTLASGLAQPSGIAFSASKAFGDYLYVALDGTETIVRIDATGVVHPFAIYPAAAFIDLMDVMFGPGVAGYTSDLYVTDLGGCGCTPGRIYRFDPSGVPNVVLIDNGESPTGLGIASGGEFGSGTVLYADVANGASDDGAFWVSPPAGPPVLFHSAAGTQLFNPQSIAQGSGGAFGTDLYLGDLGNFSDGTVSFFVSRRAENGFLAPFVSGLVVSGYYEGRLAMAPSGSVLAVNSSTTVYEVYPTTSPDLTGDGHVDAADLALLLGEWQRTTSVADLNCDGAVDAADLAVLLGAWG